MKRRRTIVGLAGMLVFMACAMLWFIWEDPERFTYFLTGAMFFWFANQLEDMVAEERRLRANMKAKESAADSGVDQAG